MPPSLHVEASSITVFDDTTKRSAIVFDKDGVTQVPFLKVCGSSDGSIRVTNVATPEVDSDATNKAYVDSAIQGLTIKAPVRLVAVGNGDLATAFAAHRSLLKQRWSDSRTNPRRKNTGNR